MHSPGPWDVYLSILVFHKVGEIWLSFTLGNSQQWSPCLSYYNVEVTADEVHNQLLKSCYKFWWSTTWSFNDFTYKYIMYQTVRFSSWSNPNPPPIIVVTSIELPLVTTLLPVSLFVLLVAHSKIHQSVSGADDTNYPETDNDSIVWGLKYSLNK